MLAIVLLSPVSPAHAAADTFTLHFINVPETVQITNPCFGPATGTITYDGVFHVTENANGYHAHFNIHGSSVTTPANLNIPPFSGDFAESQVLNLNAQNEVSSFVVTQRTHGMKFHITFHFTLNADGGTLTVFNVACGD